MLETRFRTRFCSVCFKSELNYETWGGGEEPSARTTRKTSKILQSMEKEKFNLPEKKTKTNSYKIEELN